MAYSGIGRVTDEHFTITRSHSYLMLASKKNVVTDKERNQWFNEVSGEVDNMDNTVFEVDEGSQQHQDGKFKLVGEPARKDTAHATGDQDLSVWEATEVAALKRRIQELERLVSSKAQVQETVTDRSDGFTNLKREQPRRTDTMYWDCGQMGHYQQNCLTEVAACKVMKKRTKRSLRGRRRFSKSPTDSGMYILAEVSDYLVYCLFDTGASKCIMSEEFAEFLKTVGLYVHPGTQQLEIADGSHMPAFGGTRVKINVAGLELYQEFLVSNISGTVILGYDFMKNHRVTIHSWDDTIVIQGRTVPLVKEGKVPMKTSVTGVTMERVGVDLMGPIRPATAKGNSYILVVSDYFTKFVEAYPLPDIEAETVADVFIREFCLRYGIPEFLHSDQGRQFESRLLQDACRVLKIKKTRIAPYHPQSDGLVERFNQTVNQMLSAYIQGKNDDWDDVLPFVMHAYRAMLQESTGMSPNFLMFGREINTPLEAMYGVSKKLNVHTYAEKLLNNLNAAHEFARDQLNKSTERSKQIYDCPSRDWNLEVGDAVWLHNPVGSRNVPVKFRKYWTGPWIIVKKCSNVIFDLEDDEGQKTTSHIDRMRHVQSHINEDEAEEPNSEVAASDDNVGEVDVECEEECASPDESYLITTHSGRRVRAPQRLQY